MGTPFENFVNLELPKRPALLLAADVSYDGDPNSGGAPAILQGSPSGTLYMRSSGTLYQKVSASAGTWLSVGSGSSSAPAAPLTTDVTYYLSPTGSDSNDGLSAGSPMATADAVLAKLPRTIRAFVTIVLAPGNYTQYILGDKLFASNTSRGDISGSSFPGISGIHFHGGHSTFTPGQGIASGTFDGSFTGLRFPFMAKRTGAGWAVDALAGRFIEVTSGPQTGLRVPIHTNSADTLTLARIVNDPDGQLFGFNLQGQSFKFVDTNVTITNPNTSPAPHITLTGETNNKSSKNSTAGYIEDKGAWSFYGIKFVSPGYYPVFALCPADMRLEACGIFSGAYFLAGSMIQTFAAHSSVNIVNSYTKASFMYATHVYAGIYENEALYLNAVGWSCQGGLIGIIGASRSFIGLANAVMSDFMYNGISLSGGRLQQYVEGGLVMSSGGYSAVQFGGGSLTLTGAYIVDNPGGTALEIDSATFVDFDNSVHIDGCAVGVQMKGTGCDVVLGGDIKNCTQAAVTFANNYFSNFNSKVALSGLTLVGNTLDLTFDGITSYSVADVAAAPGSILKGSNLNLFGIRATLGTGAENNGTWTPPAPGANRTVTIPAGVQPGYQTTGAQSQILGEVLRIVGTTTLATLTSGANSGTAGAGSSPAQLVKPTGQPDWTTNNLASKLVKMLTGPCMPSDGSPLYVPVVSNSGNIAIFDEPVPGFDSTCTWQIVNTATQVGRVSSSVLNAIDIRELYGRVEVYALDFSESAGALDSLIYARDCSFLKVQGCKISINTANPSVFTQNVLTTSIEHCIQTNGGDIKISEGFTVGVHGLTSNGGGVLSVEDCHVVKATHIRATNAPSRVVEFINIGKAQLEVTANGGSAVPVYLEDCRKFTPLGTLVTGANPAAPWGLEIQGSGNYNLVGCDISGAAFLAETDSFGAPVNRYQMNFVGDLTKWSTLADPAYGSVQKWGASAFGVAGFSKTLLRGNLGMEGALDVGGRMLTFGYLNLAANTKTIPLLAGYTLDMENSTIKRPDGFYYPTGTESPRAVAVVSGNAAGARVMLPYNASIAGALCIIINVGTFPVTVIAPNATYLASPPTDRLGNPFTNGTLIGSISTVNASGISAFISLNTPYDAGTPPNPIAHDFAGVFQS